MSLWCNDYEIATLQQLQQYVTRALLLTYSHRRATSQLGWLLDHHLTSWVTVTVKTDNFRRQKKTRLEAKVKEQRRKIITKPLAGAALYKTVWRHMSLIFYNCHSFCYRMTLILKILVEVSENVTCTGDVYKVIRNVCFLFVWLNTV